MVGGGIIYLLLPRPQGIKAGEKGKTKRKEAKKKEEDNKSTTSLKTSITTVCCSELFRTYCRTQKQCSSPAVSLSETSGTSLLGFCDSLRVTCPHVVVIGLLCVDVAGAFSVPQGSGSLCLDVVQTGAMGVE